MPSAALSGIALSQMSVLLGIGPVARTALVPPEIKEEAAKISIERAARKAREAASAKRPRNLG